MLVEAIKILGKINENNHDNINLLRDIIYKTQSNDVCLEALNSLDVIDSEKKELINVLRDLLNEIKYKPIYPDLVTILRKIKPGSIDAVSLLCDWIKTEKNKLIIITILKSLGKAEFNQLHIINTLNNLNFIYASTDDLIQLEAIDVLGNFSPVGLDLETLLIQLTDNSLDENICLRAVEILRKYYPYNSEIKTILIRLVNTLKDDNLCLRVIEILAKDHPFHVEIEIALIQLIKTSNDKNICLKIVELLGVDYLKSLKITKALIKVTYEKEDILMCWEIIAILGNSPKYPEVITRLTELTNKTHHEYTRLQSAQSLFLIDPFNPNIINTLIDLFLTSKEIRILQETFDTFKQLNDNNSFLRTVDVLKNNLSEEYYRTNFEQFNHCCHIIWHCAQNLSYPDFYQAWHHPLMTLNPEVLDTIPIDSPSITQALNPQLLPNELPAHCLYLDVQALNPYNLPELSQELCNLIHQHLNQYPIPEAHNLPQLKRHLLPLIRQHPQLTLIFGNVYPRDTLLIFCQQINATIPILWINDQAIPNFQTFSPQDPNLIESITQWLNNAITEQ